LNDHLSYAAALRNRLHPSALLWLGSRVFAFPGLSTQIEHGQPKPLVWKLAEAEQILAATQSAMVELGVSFGARPITSTKIVS
jgi:hypothetical protein